jgi:quinol-cytochrome oxidoreductase complex cytochrome b subunit
MTQSKRIVVPVAPQHSSRVQRKTVPWFCLVVLILALIIILGLWGKLPKIPRLQHETPGGNAPGTAGVMVGGSLHI